MDKITEARYMNIFEYFRFDRNMSRGAIIIIDSFRSDEDIKTREDLEKLVSNPRVIDRLVNERVLRINWINGDVNKQTPYRLNRYVLDSLLDTADKVSNGDQFLLDK